MDFYKIIVITPAGKPDSSMAIAASRAGELGILNLEYCKDFSAAQESIELLAKYSKGAFGIKLGLKGDDFPLEVGSYLKDSRPEHFRQVILTFDSSEDLLQTVQFFHESGVTIFLECCCLDQAHVGEKVGIDGIIAKGHEAGGRVGEETSFILLQRILTQLSLPVFVYGGVGLHTAASCYAAGARGVVLDSQLLLTKESPLSDDLKKRFATFDGSETICLGERINSLYRVYGRPNLPLIKKLLYEEDQLIQNESPEGIEKWRNLISRHIGWQSPDDQLFPLGQDISFAPLLAHRFRTVGGVLGGIRKSIEGHLRSAKRIFPLKEGSPLTKSHGTRYPIVQGPMARISDTPEFALQVAEKGALPFIELAMMRKKEVLNLLAECKERLCGHSWGVGILGFIQPNLLKEQTEAILVHKPSHVLIAGGRAEQVKSFESEGISTYIHCPSPELLKVFLNQGLRKFVFEGMESGGHLGPRTSFILWEKSLEVLMDFFSSGGVPSSCQILLAGGIHDALSSLMVSVLTAPLAEMGIQVGVQLGSAYLFTEEAVSSSAMVKGFQKQIVAAKSTTRLEAGPGYVTRCLPTPFTRVFRRERQRMISEGRSTNEIRDTLETLNLGRLRISAKGIDRHPSKGPQDPLYLEVSEEEQLERGVYMMGQMVALCDHVSHIEDLHRKISLEGKERLDQFLEEEKKAHLQVLSPKLPDIALIGMACVLPKAPDLYTYWSNILNKVDAIEEISQDRWDYRSYYHEDRKARDKIYSKWGGFFQEVPFDPLVYGMPPNSLSSIEPLHLIALEVVRAALSDAGYLDRSFAWDRTSVIIGVGGGMAELGLRYSVRSFLPLVEQLSGGQFKADRLIMELQNFFPEWTEDSFSGILANVAAGRVANRFNLGGTNFTVDAACASSMASLYLALKELQTYTSDMVIAGGADTMQNPFTYLCFSKTQALSPSGKSRPLDESADGIVLGEGVGIVILKRLADAERDGDRIYAVIKAVGSSSDGRDKSLTAPRPEGQILALTRAYHQAHLCPSTIGLIEAHGTGTIVGDRTEVQALSKVFSAAQASLQSCAIGSVKSMIGHTKCTAGVAGLIKVALALHTKTLPPTLGVTQPNQKANFSQTPFYINTETRPWFNSQGEYPRRAGVSAFGFGGTNFHAIMEEYNLNYSHTECISPPWPCELCLWQAESKEKLEKEIVNTLEKSEQLPLWQSALRQWKSLKSIKEPLSANFRLAVIATSIKDLTEKLDRVRKALGSGERLDVLDPQGIYLTEHASGAGGKVAFLFPGQGAQYPHMAKDYVLSFPEALFSFERIDRILFPCLGKDLTDYIFPKPSFTDEERDKQNKELTQTRIAQPAIGAVSIALFNVLSQLGVHPDMAAGHSYGEYTALWAAGSLTEESLMILSEARGRIIGASSSPGVMAAIRASEKEL